jgi:hypothetical protein
VTGRAIAELGRHAPELAEAIVETASTRGRAAPLKRRPVGKLVARADEIHVARFMRGQAEGRERSGLEPASVRRKATTELAEHTSIFRIGAGRVAALEGRLGRQTGVSYRTEGRTRTAVGGILRRGRRAPRLDDGEGQSGGDSAQQFVRWEGECHVGSLAVRPLARVHGLAFS